MIKQIVRPLLCNQLPLRGLTHWRRFCATGKLQEEPPFGIQSKYTDEDVSKIIQTVNHNSLNELLNYDISKGRAQKIRSWLNRNGHFTSVDQLLELDGFGEKNLEKFCGSIISGESLVDRVRPAARNQQFTTPPLSAKMRSEIKTFTSVHIGITSISWAQFELEPDCPTQLSDWSFNVLPEKKLHISEFITSVLDIVTCIPDSDLYVFETPRVAHQGPQGTPATINISVQMSQIAAMAAMSMAARQPQMSADPSEAAESVRKVHVLFLRQFLASRLFHTIVGTERTSTASVVSALLEKSYQNMSGRKLEESPIAGEIIVSPRLQSVYAAGEGHCKEYLGQSLLMGLSFLRLCLLQCPHSLGVLKARSRN